MSVTAQSSKLNFQNGPSDLKISWQRYSTLIIRFYTLKPSMLEQPFFCIFKHLVIMPVWILTFPEMSHFGRPPLILPSMLEILIASFLTKRVHGDRWVLNRRPRKRNSSTNVSFRSESWKKVTSISTFFVPDLKFHEDKEWFHLQQLSFDRLRMLSIFTLRSSLKRSWEWDHPKVFDILSQPNICTLQIVNSSAMQPRDRWKHLESYRHLAGRLTRRLCGILWWDDRASKHAGIIPKVRKQLQLLPNDDMGTGFEEKCSHFYWKYLFIHFGVPLFRKLPHWYLVPKLKNIILLGAHCWSHPVTASSTPREPPSRRLFFASCPRSHKNTPPPGRCMANATTKRPSRKDFDPSIR